MRDVTQVKPGLELIGVMLAIATFITVAIAAFVVTSDMGGDIAAAHSVSAQDSPLRDVFN
ncbi:MAG: hypothetical protein ACXWJW_03945 [Xanthobacteraceae bacterium]